MPTTDTRSRAPTPRETHSPFASVLPSTRTMSFLFFSLLFFVFCFRSRCRPSSACRVFAVLLCAGGVVGRCESRIPRSLKQVGFRTARREFRGIGLDAVVKFDRERGQIWRGQRRMNTALRAPDIIPLPLPFALKFFKRNNGTKTPV